MNQISAYFFSCATRAAPYSREGVLLFEEGRWAEASPLPNWSPESLEEVIQALRRNAPSAALDFAKDSLKAISPTPFSVPLAALLSGTPDEIMEQCKTVLHCGFNTVKVKIGHLRPQEAKRVLRELLLHFRVRVDVNRSYEAQDSLALFSHFAKDAFEYIEEPFKNPTDLSRFTHPFALDETLRECPELLEADLPLLKAIVLKPTMTSNYPRIAQKALSKGMSVVISSSYEAGVGTYHLARLAKQWMRPDCAVGLYPYALIEEDVLKHPLQLKEGRLMIPNKLQINHSRLTPLNL